MLCTWGFCKLIITWMMMMMMTTTKTMMMAVMMTTMIVMVVVSMTQMTSYLVCEYSKPFGGTVANGDHNVSCAWKIHRTSFANYSDVKTSQFSIERNILNYSNHHHHRRPRHHHYFYYYYFNAMQNYEISLLIVIVTIDFITPLL